MNSPTGSSSTVESFTPLRHGPMSDLDAEKNPENNAGNTNAEKEALLSQIQQLKAALQEAQLKAEGYELMIQLAEKQFQIPIRKKSATK